MPVTSRRPSLNRVTCTTTSMAEVTCARSACRGRSTFDIMHSVSSLFRESSGLLACSVLIEPACPEVIA